MGAEGSRGTPGRKRKRRLTDADLAALVELAERHDQEFIELLRRYSREMAEMKDRHWHESNAIKTGVPSPPGRVDPP